MKALNFVTVEDLKAMGDPEWLIDGVLPMGGTAMLFGKGESFKSFIALDMMNCVVTGTDFAGRKTKQVKGLYIAAEGGPQLKKRWIAWELHNDTEVNNMDLIMDEAIMLDDPHEVEQYAQVIKERGYQFIIFDTLRTSVSGDSSEGDKAFSAVTKSMRILARVCDATVLVVHHTTKGDDSTYAGWNSLATNSATVMRVKRNDDSPFATLECTKQKDSDRFAPMMFESKKIEKADSLVMVHKGLATIRKKAPVEVNAIVTYLKDNKVRKATKNDIAKGLDMWREAKSCPTSAFDALLGEAVKAGQVKRVERDIELV